MSITSAQIRGARGILGWSQGDLGKRAGISATSIGSIEKGHTNPRDGNIENIRRALEDGGIEFLDSDGMRKKTAKIQVFRGRKGFASFYDDIYETLRDNPGQVCVSNVDERHFSKWHGEFFDEHKDRMMKIKGLTYKILVKKGDDFFSASEYAEYRWLPEDLFSFVPFYVYGEKLAILLFEDTPTVIVLEYKAVSEAYRIQFKVLWDSSETIKEK